MKLEEVALNPEYEVDGLGMFPKLKEMEVGTPLVVSSHSECKTHYGEFISYEPGSDLLEIANSITVPVIFGMPIFEGDQSRIMEFLQELGDPNYERKTQSVPLYSDYRIMSL